VTSPTWSRWQCIFYVYLFYTKPVRCS
jgi:hypothetical protein